MHLLETKQIVSATKAFLFWILHIYLNFHSYLCFNNCPAVHRHNICSTICMLIHCNLKPTPVRLMNKNICRCTMYVLACAVRPSILKLHCIPFFISSNSFEMCISLQARKRKIKCDRDWLSQSWKKKIESGVHREKKV